MTRPVHTESGLPPVTIVRRKRQRTMRIRVNDDGVVVSGPASVSRNALLDFVREKRDWIQKTSDRRQQRIRALGQQREANRGTLLLRGKRQRITGRPVSDNGKPRLVEAEEHILFEFPSDSRKVQTRQLSLLDSDGSDRMNTGNHLPDPGLVEKFYRTLAKSELPERVHYWSDRLPWHPSRISIRNQKTKWGSCSSRGTISLNWRLIKCPEHIMDYIIIHELCHLRHFNHSRAFWEAVAHWYPDVKQARAWIRAHSDEIFGDL